MSLGRPIHVLKNPYYVPVSRTSIGRPKYAQRTSWFIVATIGVYRTSERHIRDDYRNILHIIYILNMSPTYIMNICIRNSRALFFILNKTFRRYILRTYTLNVHRASVVRTEKVRYIYVYGKLNIFIIISSLSLLILLLYF